MRCLVPVHQERYPEKSLKRSCKICDETYILYIVDRKVIEKVKGESSYILPSYSLESLEDFIIEMQRKEAEKLKNSVKKSNLIFVVSEYYQAIERELLKEKYDMMLVDSYLRGFLEFDIPVWIERGEEIKEITFVVSSLLKINKIKKSMRFLKEIEEKLGAKLYLFIPPENREKFENIIQPMGEITHEIRGELIVYQRDMKEGYKIHKNKNILFI